MAKDGEFQSSGRGSFEFSLGDELRGERATLGKTLLDIQRDLRIKASYIAAIEDARPEVFPNPSFIAGYVRSYARYLGLDPDEVYRRFCAESGFTGRAAAAPVSAKPAARAGAGVGPAVARAKVPGFSPDFAITRGEGRRLPAIPFAALGSLAMLAALIVGIGFGGWTVLQNIQRVQFAPVEELPVAVAEIDSLAPPEPGVPGEVPDPELDRPVTATALADLYRQQELAVPIVAPRDGPIAALNPDVGGLVQGPVPAAATAGAGEVPAALVEAAPAADAPAVAAAPEAVPVVIVAERAAWIRVYLANGTVLFESILEKGQSYSPPEGVDAPLVWAGNSGSVYVRVADTLYGPLGSGTRAAKDISLVPADLIGKYSVVTDVPEVISQSMPAATAGAEPAVAIQ